MRTVATIEARMTSSRLPGKVLLLANGKPLLEHLVERLKRVQSIDSIVLATTINPADDVLAELSSKLDILCYRGDEDDVMGRVIGAAELGGAEVVVEITGDCPIIDPQIVEQAIRMYKANDASYVSNAVIRTYPDGMDVQVFALETLKKSSEMTKNRLDREHVTLHIRNNPKLFSHLHLVAASDLHWPDLGLTLDEKSDYDFLKKIIEHFGSKNQFFDCADIIKFLDENKELLEINRNVIRKGNT